MSGPPENKKPKLPRGSKAMPTGVIGRVGRLAATSLRGSVRAAMLAPKSIFTRTPNHQLLEELHASTARDLALTLGRLKGASMKVGQLASFIDAGVLPIETRDTYQQILSQLRDSAPPMKPALVHAVFAEEFDATPTQLFSAFEMKPAAAASLGQVHYAVTKDGREVAVKVQYPGIQSAVKSDLALAEVSKPLIPLLAPGMDVDEALEEIRSRVLAECDYTLEAEHTDFLAAKYEGHPFFWVPRTIPELSSPRILTMQRASGLTFDEVKQLPKSDRDRFSEILFRFYYGSLHRFGFTSADPHPGNYKLMRDGRVAFFDFGLVFNLDQDKRPSMLKGLLALNAGDVDGFFDSGVELGFISKPDTTDRQRWFDWVHSSLAPVVEDRDYQFTRDFIAKRTQPFVDPRNEWWSFIRHLNLPKWAILQYRLELGLFAVLAQLEASGNWHRMTMEFYEQIEPSTQIGASVAHWLDSS